MAASARKPVPSTSRRAARFAVIGQNLRGAADAAPKRFIECDTAKLPSVTPAMPVDLPLRGPSKIPLAPDQPSDHGDLPALLGCKRSQFCGWHRAQLGA